MTRRAMSLARIGALCCALAITLPVAGRGADTKPPNVFRMPNPPAAPALAPQVRSDRTVIFQIRAPDATKVELRMIPGTPQPMNRNLDGTWHITVGPWEPEIYGYTFVVDGVRLPDPSNPEAVVGRSGIFSLVEIPGKPARFDERQEVPHGSLHIREYRSNVLGTHRRIVIYVPPEFDREPATRLPVLYLRHGTGDLETAWSEIGRAGVILENLLFQGQAVPMIIAMPNGYPGETGHGSSPEGIELTSRELIGEIIPLIEKNFRTLTGRESRAIAGLSMGGGQAFLTGLRHPEMFAWVAEFSSGLISDEGFRLEQAVPGFLETAAAPRHPLGLLFLSCGTEDPRYPGHLALVETLTRHGIRHEWFSTPGQHEWKVWRHSLAALLPKLFRQPPRDEPRSAIKNEQP